MIATGSSLALLWFAVRLYAITLAGELTPDDAELWFAVRLYAITLRSFAARWAGGLWFAVRLYAITLVVIDNTRAAGCGLRSGYMRLHLTLFLLRLSRVVVCGQAICDYTDGKAEPTPYGVVVCGQAICDYTLLYTFALLLSCGLRSGYMRLHSLALVENRLEGCGLRSGYMRLHLTIVTSNGLVSCGLRSGYMRLHSKPSAPASITVVVCGQAICDYTCAVCNHLWWRVVVCGQAICDYTCALSLPVRRLLWFAVRLYAITLGGMAKLAGWGCGLRSGYMRLH